MSKLMSITVQGKHKKWCFDFYADPKFIDEWVADGLEIDLIYNSIPVWVVECGLLRPWCFMQDLFNFKNPFK